MVSERNWGRWFKDSERKAQNYNIRDRAKKKQACKIT